MSRSTARAAGRRATPDRRPRGDRTTAAALVLLLLSAVAVTLAVRSAPNAADSGLDAARTSLVDRTRLACPGTAGLSEAGTGLRTSVAAGLAEVRPALPEGETLGATGSLRVGAPGQDGSDLALDRGRLVVLPADPAPALDAQGAPAVGLFAHRTDRTSGSTAVVPCAAPRGSWWFTGAGAGLDHGSDLVMTNLDPGPAVVDVRLYGADGQVETIGTRGIPLGPGESATIPLSDVAPQAEELAVAVEASRGRVAAAVLDRFAAEPGGPQGLEWLPGTDRPARTLLLAGLPPRAVARTLLVANPGERQALAEVELAGAGGSFAPAGLDQVSVAPGAVASVDLSGVVPADEPVAVRVRSEVPLVATVRSVGPRDVGYAGPVDPLTAPAAVPALAATSVLLTAGEGPARARVLGYTEDGELTGRQQVRIDPTATAVWRPGRGTAYAVVVPLEGEVHGAASYAGTGVLTQLPLVGLPVVVLTPRVVPGPR